MEVVCDKCGGKATARRAGAGLRSPLKQLQGIGWTFKILPGGNEVVLCFQCAQPKERRDGHD